MVKGFFYTAVLCITYLSSTNFVASDEADAIKSLKRAKVNYAQKRYEDVCDNQQPCRAARERDVIQLTVEYLGLQADDTLRNGSIAKLNPALLVAVLPNSDQGLASRFNPLNIVYAQGSTPESFFVRIAGLLAYDPIDDVNTTNVTFKDDLSVEANSKASQALTIPLSFTDTGDIMTDVNTYLTAISAANSSPTALQTALLAQMQGFLTVAGCYLQAQNRYFELKHAERVAGGEVKTIA